MKPTLYLLTMSAKLYCTSTLYTPVTFTGIFDVFPLPQVIQGRFGDHGWNGAGLGCGIYTGLSITIGVVQFVITVTVSKEYSFQASFGKDTFKNSKNSDKFTYASTLITLLTVSIWTFIVYSLLLHPW